MSSPEVLETPFDCPAREVIERVAEAISSGLVVVIPTDTLYGIAADPMRREVLSRVYEIKEREEDKPIPLLLGESHDALKLVKPTKLFWRLAYVFWPGPLTLVAEPSPEAPPHLRAWGAIGVRLPRCPLCREVARLVGGVITGTSANISGMDPAITASEAMSMLGARIDLYVDSGPAPLAKPSTVVDVRGEEPVIIREGAIPAEKILEVARE